MKYVLIILNQVLVVVFILSTIGTLHVLGQPALRASAVAQSTTTTVVSVAAQHTDRYADVVTRRLSMLAFAIGAQVVKPTTNYLLSDVLLIEKGTVL